MKAILNFIHGRFGKIVLKGYNWHVLAIYDNEELDKILLMGSATNEPIHEFNSTALDAIAAEIDMVKMSIQFK